MNPSVELKNVMLRFYESESSGDVSAIGHLISRREGVLAIGTDPDEWWVGYDTIDRHFVAQWQEIGKVQIRAGELSAFAEGTVGWVADQASMRLPNGKEIALRMTAVLHAENGEWRIVQLHASLGVPNMEALGQELTIK